MGMRIRSGRLRRRRSMRLLSIERKHAVARRTRACSSGRRAGQSRPRPRSQPWDASSSAARRTAIGLPIPAQSAVDPGRLCGDPQFFAQKRESPREKRVLGHRERPSPGEKRVRATPIASLPRREVRSVSKSDCLPGIAPRSEGQASHCVSRRRTAARDTVNSPPRPRPRSVAPAG
jgi:hypothetical protein